MIRKSLVIFYLMGLIAGAVIGIAIHKLIIGMGLGAAIGIILARHYRRRTGR